MDLDLSFCIVLVCTTLFQLCFGFGFHNYRYFSTSPSEDKNSNSGLLEPKQYKSNKELIRIPSMWTKYIYWRRRRNTSRNDFPVNRKTVQSGYRSPQKRYLHYSPYLVKSRYNNDKKIIAGSSSKPENDAMRLYNDRKNKDKLLVLKPEGLQPNTDVITDLSLIYNPRKKYKVAGFRNPLFNVQGSVATSQETEKGKGANCVTGQEANKDDTTSFAGTGDDVKGINMFPSLEEIGNKVHYTSNLMPREGKTRQKDENDNIINGGNPVDDLFVDKQTNEQDMGRNFGEYDLDSVARGVSKINFRGVGNIADDNIQNKVKANRLIDGNVGQFSDALDGNIPQFDSFVLKSSALGGFENNNLPKTVLDLEGDDGDRTLDQSSFGLNLNSIPKVSDDFIDIIYEGENPSNVPFAPGFQNFRKLSSVNDKMFIDVPQGRSFEGFDSIIYPEQELAADVAGFGSFGDIPMDKLDNIEPGFHIIQGPGEFVTDESGCDGIETRSCTSDSECSCYGLYFCIEGRCSTRSFSAGSIENENKDGTFLDFTVPPN